MCRCLSRPRFQLSFMYTWETQLGPGYLCVWPLEKSPHISTATARFPSPTSNAQASPFLHIFSSMCHFPVLDCSHPSSCEVLSVVFISSSPTANDAKHLFKYLLAVCMSLEKCHFSSPCTFLYGVVFVVRLGEYFIHSECWILSSVRLASIFSWSAVSGCCSLWGQLLETRKSVCRWGCVACYRKRGLAGAPTTSIHF